MARRKVMTMFMAQGVLAEVLNELRDDKIDTEKARAIVYTCSALINCIKEADLERRLDRLERLAGGMVDVIDIDVEQTGEIGAGTPTECEKNKLFD